MLLMQIEIIQSSGTIDLSYERSSLVIKRLRDLFKMKLFEGSVQFILGNRAIQEMITLGACRILSRKCII